MLNRGHQLDTDPPAAALAARRGEQGIALVAAIALLLIAACVAVAILLSTRSSLDSSRERQDENATTLLARDASTALAGAYSSMASGEFDAFVPADAVLAEHAKSIGGTTVPNSAFPTSTGLNKVDDARMPGGRRQTVVRPLGDGRDGYWQIYSVAMPDWGDTPGGRVVVYTRIWTSPSGQRNKPTQPLMYRLEFRPTWFADFQLLFDGPWWVAAGATLDGRIHSNGYSSSFYNMYETLGSQLKIDGTCAPTARITVAAGSVSGSGSCTSKAKLAPGVRYDLLRARDAATRLREICLGGAPHPNIQMVCPDIPSTTVASITLSGSTVSVSPGGSVSAAVTGRGPNDNQGAVIVVPGNATVRGRLADNARATIVASAISADYGNGGAPSITVNAGGDVGSSGAAGSSFGVMAEGDVVLDEWQACPVTFRGALLSMSGMLTENPRWRNTFPVSGGRMCGGKATILGSISGHYPPILRWPANNAGYSDRQYSWLKSLYDNPPPMYATASDWETTRSGPANLDCFTSGTLDMSNGKCL